MKGIRVGFIGLGAIGRPMAAHLARAGCLVAVGNRSHAKAEAFAREFRVTAPADIAELSRACNVIVLCVPADADVTALADAIAANAAPGTIVIDHSTVSPATSRAAHARLGASGSNFLDAPVSGGVEGAIAGTLTIMAGGDEAALTTVRPVLDCYAARINHMGPVGAGEATKAVNQVLVAGIAEAVCEGLALGAASGLDPAKLLAAIGAGAAQCWFLDKRGATMLRGEFGTGFKLSLLLKDLGIVRELARTAGTDRTVIEQALADAAALTAGGHGDEDISALIRLKRRG